MIDDYVSSFFMSIQASFFAVVCQLIEEAVCPTYVCWYTFIHYFKMKSSEVHFRRYLKKAD